MKDLMKDTIKTLSILSVATLTTLSLTYGTIKFSLNCPAVGFDAKNHIDYIVGLNNYKPYDACNKRGEFWQKFLKENNLTEDKREFIQKDGKRIKVSELYKIIDNWNPYS